LCGMKCKNMENDEEKKSNRFHCLTSDIFERLSSLLVYNNFTQNDSVWSVSFVF
jgi:hypothetical protein